MKSTKRRSPLSRKLMKWAVWQRPSTVACQNLKLKSRQLVDKLVLIARVSSRDNLIELVLVFSCFTGPLKTVVGLIVPVLYVELSLNSKKYCNVLFTLKVCSEGDERYRVDVPVGTCGL